MKPDIKRVKSLYGVQSFDAATAYAKKNFKDAGGIILARNLEHVSAEIFTQEFAGLTFLQQGIAVNNRGGMPLASANSNCALKAAFANLVQTPAPPARLLSAVRMIQFQFSQWKASLIGLRSN